MAHRFHLLLLLGWRDARSLGGTDCGKGVAVGEQTGRRITVKQTLAAIVVVIVVILAIANSRKVRVDLVVTDVTMRLFVVIVASAVLGWVVGWFMGRSRD